MHIVGGYGSSPGGSSQFTLTMPGAQLIYLPPYSPDFNPIEMAFSKMKALLRKAAARSIPELWDVIADCIDQFNPNECQNYFAAAGYDHD